MSATVETAADVRASDDVYRPPETWARRAYPNLIYFNEVDKGGHFAAWEQPQLFSEELRAAFSSLH
jgi:pimeloyl-ACP methyl ester carboxylesterase